MNSSLDQLQATIAPQRKALLSHPVYTAIHDLPALRLFTATHIFAVWDFMSLLKSLQLELTSVTLPWKPVGNAATRYLINEIVVGEESDVDEYGNRISHFELYLQAMQQLEANTQEIERFVSQLPDIKGMDAYIAASSLPEAVKSFLGFTFRIASSAPAHVKAAVFTFGREDLIPNMFLLILERLYTEAPDKTSIFKYYIKRHIEVDGDHHSQLGLEMVSRLCGQDEEKWKEATAASLEALVHRYHLWDHIFTCITKR